MAGFHSACTSVCFVCLFVFWENIQQPQVQACCHLHSTVFVEMWPVTYGILHGPLAGDSFLCPYVSAWENKPTSAETDLKSMQEKGKKSIKTPHPAPEAKKTKEENCGLKLWD